MLRSIIVAALRSFLRNRSFSFINLLGLAISMSLSLLIILIVKQQFTFDNFHRDAERIYRVNTLALRADGSKEPYASTPLPIGQLLRDNYSFTEKLVRINNRLNGDAVFGNTIVPVHGLFTDPEFLEVFNFPLSKGNSATALSQPNGVVLTHEAAVKIFGSQEPLGQTVSLRGYGDFVVTGVMSKFKGKTHFDFEILASTSLLPVLEKQGAVSPSLEDWNNYYSGYVYVKLREGTSLPEVEKALAAMAKSNYAGLKLELRDKGYEFYLHPLSKITPGPMLSNQMGHGLPDILLIFLGSFAAIILIMACFNYTNLVIAKSLSRAREIGVRKIMGAARWQVFLQFVTEAVVFSLLSLIASYGLMQLMKPAFLQLHITNEFAIDLTEDWSLFFIFLTFAVLVGMVAGLLPASYLSAFRPATVLKDAGNLKVYSRLTFRKALMVSQFALSLIFIVVVIVIYQQVNFVLSADYGFNENDLINLRLQGTPFTRLANEISALPGVTRVGGISHSLGTWQDGSNDYKRNSEDEPFEMRDFAVDEHYLLNLEIPFLAGKNFETQTDDKKDNVVILNESALPRFGFADARSALGQVVFMNDSVMLRVVGVVKDFHYRPMNYKIGPLALRYNKSQINILNAQIDLHQKDAIVMAIKSIWKRTDPVHPIQWSMMNEEIDQAYVDSGFTDVLVITGYIAFIAIGLACLGMLGMALYATQTRVKEIGVRKVLGASVLQVVMLLNQSFLKLISIAVIIGTPVAFWLGNMVLDNYAYRIEVTPWILLSGIALIAGSGIITICSQTIKAASTNPADSLRWE